MLQSTLECFRSRPVYIELTLAGNCHTYEQCLAIARESGVTIYPLDLGKNVAKEILESLGRQTGGRAYFPPAVKDLQEVYGKVAEELRSQYSRGYSSTNRLRDGAWRNLQVTVEIPGSQVRRIEGFNGRSFPGVGQYSGYRGAMGARGVQNEKDVDLAIDFCRGDSIRSAGGGFRYRDERCRSV